ncbi:hypothetical protein QBC35DRAFT_501046 [Podospora australis]|uniref:Uncharacterized protein n=1 Tax=Podospora australis TaxID=1536484 RepID=A0AAN7AH75_9PEZI|nr:hypothetical protein QBC35DRAFT_501046 [Podospora australis]
MSNMENAESCPEDSNSTECLLRRIAKLLDDQKLNDSSGFDWDQITFAFTVPIGIFAALFAAITIYQAVLASGPGRRKSNSRAIGPWAAYTRSEWSWRELNRLSFATTPLMRLGEMLPNLEQYLDLDTQLPPRWHSGPEPEDSVATWLRFLTYTGLIDPLMRFNKGKKHALADYLPSDLVAAPSYAEVGFLVTAAVATGATIESTDSRYPILIGPDFQLEFRQHPTLGIIAAFSSFEALKPLSYLPLRYRLRVMVQAFMHSRGLIIVPKHDSNKAGSRKTSVAAREPRTAFKIKELSPTLYGKEESILPFLQHHLYRNDYYGLFTYLTAQSMSTPPQIFPLKFSLPRRHQALGVLALNGKFWLRWEADTRYRLIDPKTDYFESQTGLVPSLDDLYTAPKIRGMMEYNEIVVAADIEPEYDSPIMLSQAILNHCTRYLLMPEAFRSAHNQQSTARQIFFRALLAYQLREVERWLQISCTAAFRTFRVLQLLDTSLAILDTKEAMLSDRPALSSNQVATGARRDWEAYKSIGSIAPTPSRSRFRGQLIYQELSHLKRIDELLQCLPGIELVRERVGRAYYGESDTERAEPENNVLEDVISDKMDAQDQRHLSILLGTREHNRKPYLLLRLQDVLQSCYETLELESRMDDERLPQKSAEEIGAGLKSRTHHEVVDDMLIWRAILVVMLFETAQDNSDLLKSSVWSHVVPML